MPIVPRLLAATLLVVAAVGGAPAAAASDLDARARERTPCNRCRERDCTRLAAVELGLRQPCRPASARAHLRPR